MSKGSSPSGNTTTTVQNTNPAEQVQEPYLQDVYTNAQGYFNSPAFGGASPLTTGAMNYLYGSAANTAPFLQNLPANAGIDLSSILGGTNPFSYGLQNVGNTATGYAGQPIAQSNATANTLTGVGSNMASSTIPYTNAMTGLAGQYTSAAAPYESGLYNLSSAALNNPASGSLGWLSSGAVLNPSSNPALASAIQSAQYPTVLNYQTATAPQTASNFEGAGRYGSGAQANAQGVNQYGLGLALGNIASGMENTNYQTGLQAMGSAAANQGNIYNTGVSNAGNMLQAGGALGLNALTGANNAYYQGGNLNLAGLTGQANALSGAGSLANQGYQVGGQLLNTANYGFGQGLTGVESAINAAPSLAGYPANAYQSSYTAGMTPLETYASIIGGPIGGTGTQTTTQPYYTNTTANVLGGLGGALGLGQLGAQAAGYSSLGALFAASDRRVKQDIEPVGRLANGLTVYRFRYVGANDNRLGLMADEVERVHPEAVITLGGEDGLKLVNYALVAA